MAWIVFFYSWIPGSCSSLFCVMANVTRQWETKPLPKSLVTSLAVGLWMKLLKFWFWYLFFIENNITYSSKGVLGQISLFVFVTCLKSGLSSFYVSDYIKHYDVIKWKHFPRYWPFVWGIHRWPVNSQHKGQWRRTLMFSLICAWINGWVNNREAGDLRCHCAHYDIIVMKWGLTLRENLCYIWFLVLWPHWNLVVLTLPIRNLRCQLMWCLLGLN